MDEERRAERYGFEAFDCAPALRLEANERVAVLKFQAIAERQKKLEEAMERLERRLWLAVYGIAGAIVAQALQPLLVALP
ncbi:GTA head formation protein, RCAP_rcc01685 family [Roseovarius sp. S1116L3]|uniref:GTA head formation protein, RCAP_rcc01685 family n=1 Tax=Roseovarius roseus TaxID=3342636 RepID=UPI00372954F1